jgi:hypothetical protein
MLFSQLSDSLTLCKREKKKKKKKGKEKKKKKISAFLVVGRVPRTTPLSEPLSTAALNNR